MLTTVQDLGRRGYQDRGMPVAGPMDSYSLRAANLLVGNEEGAAALEVTLLGPELQFGDAATVAIAGAEFDVSVDGGPFPFHTSMRVASGSVLKFGSRRRGARAYLAVAGGVSVPPVLGSRATHLASRTGGCEGRALKPGDVLSTGQAAESRGATPARLPLPERVAGIRVLAGPHNERFGVGALSRLAEIEFRVSAQSNRVGYRLEGARVGEDRVREGLISIPMPAGALQVPPSGEPILLMADRGTTGGYPVIAVAITADLPIAGQLAPGDALRFIPCTREAALEALHARESALHGRPV
jgi:antagonist of KipI